MRAALDAIWLMDAIRQGSVRMMVAGASQTNQDRLNAAKGVLDRMEKSS